MPVSKRSSSVIRNSTSIRALPKPYIFIISIPIKIKLVNCNLVLKGL
jgi:hypothetical protein